MNLLFLTGDTIAQPLTDWLIYQEHETVCLCTEKLSVDFVRNVRPDMLISYNYRHIIHENILDILEQKAINLHISFLPWNKGAHPNVWSFLEDTPKGVTIHLIDKSVDTGDILLQREIFFDEEIETLASSYKKLHQEIQRLFMMNWKMLKRFQLPAKKQSALGTKHYAKKFEAIKAVFGEQIWNMTIAQFKRKYREMLT
jgi:methionyl-tRNA formyltransferase